MTDNRAITAAKATLRAQLRAERARFAAGRRGVPPLPLPSDWIARLPPGAAVASYRPVGAEIDPASIEAQLAAAGHPLAYPRVDRADAPLSFRLAPAPADWERGPHGITQPAMTAAVVQPALILAPLLGFTRAGARLGQGGGYYDRTLAGLPHALAVGVAWSMQERGDMPLETWDRPLDAIVTEQQWITP